MASDIPAREGFVTDSVREADVGDASDRFPEILVNRQSAVPLHIQIKEQIRYAIISGDLLPGDPLPSIRDLTAQLRVHRNTVHRVYLELRAAGLLVSRPGVGMFVDESLATTVSSTDLESADALIEDLFAQANQLGINPVAVSRLVAQRAPAWDSRHPTVAFVECTAHQSAECAKDLSDAFGVRVEHLLLDELSTEDCGVCSKLRHVVTSAFHLDEVQEWASRNGRRVHAVTYGLHPATRRTLRALSKKARLGFICQDANTEEVIGRQVAALVPSGVYVGGANLESPQQALDLIDRVDTVILTEAAAPFCITHCTPDHELVELHFALNPKSVEKVRRIIQFEQ
jgi:DNA-binding transcriptional regulator YhcF (GntR family)